MNHHHSYSILVTGIARFYLIKLIKEHPHPLALVEALDENSMVEGKSLFCILNISVKSRVYFLSGPEFDTTLIPIQLFFTEFHAGSSELKALVREFRSHALELLDMLDSSLPIVARLRVCKHYY